ncbi:MAG: PepSY domain-containing protein [Acidobacteria bacterium]|nr:PepSY domain-containing protein [Acidobacteriota bacterium]
MKLRNYKFYLRKAHRYLGVFIGIQFLFWTLGGLYFSWTNIDQIRSDDVRKENHTIDLGAGIGSPQTALEQFRLTDPTAQVLKLQVVEVLGEPFYEIAFHGSDGKVKTVLAAVSDGRLRAPISESEAIQIAKEGLKISPKVVSAAYLTPEMIGADHEYREKPMPAWAVTFEGDLTMYVSAETGQIGAIRNTRWRIFDFLWMLHTLDFKARDDINNYLLRAFSVLGIVTVGSGFALFFVSSRVFRRHRANRP